MANEKNLKPIRSESEAREKGKKGGIESGKSRRKQKSYRELAKVMLSAQLTNKKMINELKRYGISETDVKAYTLLGMIKASAAGSHSAFDRLMELTGEKTENANASVMAKLDKVLGDIDAIADK